MFWWFVGTLQPLSASTCGSVAVSADERSYMIWLCVPVWTPDGLPQELESDLLSCRTGMLRCCRPLRVMEKFSSTPARTYDFDGVNMRMCDFHDAFPLSNKNQNPVASFWVMETTSYFIVNFSDLQPRSLLWGEEFLLEMSRNKWNIQWTLQMEVLVEISCSSVYAIYLKPHLM